MDVKCTSRGTKVAARWDADWIAFVEHVEGELDRRICGAASGDGAPCELAPASENGRCAFHGGTPHIGAPVGNVNALTHGLHARRLRPCGKTCPHWERCAFADPAIEEMPLAKRPACVFEASAFGQMMRAIFDALSIDPGNPYGLELVENTSAKAFEASADRGKTGGAADFATQMWEFIEDQYRWVVGLPFLEGLEDAENREYRKDDHPSSRMARIVAVESAEAYALSKVMTQRAAGIVAGSPLSDAVEEVGENRRGQTSTVSGATEAYLKFQREQRHWLGKVETSSAALVAARQQYRDGLVQSRGEEGGMRKFFTGGLSIDEMQAIREKAAIMHDLRDEALAAKKRTEEEEKTFTTETQRTQREEEACKKGDWGDGGDFGDGEIGMESGVDPAECDEEEARRLQGGHEGRVDVDDELVIEDAVVVDREERDGDTVTGARAKPRRLADPSPLSVPVRSLGEPCGALRWAVILPSGKLAKPRRPGSGERTGKTKRKK